MILDNEKKRGKVNVLEKVENNLEGESKRDEEMFGKRKRKSDF